MRVLEYRLSDMLEVAEYKYAEAKLFGSPSVKDKHNRIKHKKI